MKKRLIILFSLFFVLSCKIKSDSEVKKEQSNTVLSKEKIVSNNLIDVYNIIGDSILSEEKPLLVSFNETINNICVNSQNNPNKSRFRDRLNWHKKKLFQKALARDFKNEKFMRIKALSISYVKLKIAGSLSSEMDIQEWVFENEETAKSCFDSFKNYEEVEIYFKVVNWIWFLKGSKLFLLYSMHEPVEKKPMQILKQRLMSFLEVNENHVKEVY